MQKRGILTKMANCVERKLVELFSDDLSDSEVRESKVKAEVTHKSSNTEVDRSVRWKHYSHSFLCPGRQ